MNLLDNFRLNKEREDFELVNQNIQNGIEFRGTNLWILIFAIFIASLGLNVNSTAVIIGAMLVSPLMGPIIGLGFGMAINDLTLLKKSLISYLFAATVGLITSCIYFLISPINEAHSEILARTAPNIYDVFIALFGGLAGILAISSRLKGNVIPGVAIATALMPPLCTAGYGLATLQFSFFFGALYLFLINSVFIALATIITIRFLKFPLKSLPTVEAEIKAKRIVWAIVVITLLPSIYFGYDQISQVKFKNRAEKFIELEAVFPNDYLLNKIIDVKSRTISLTYGGEIIEEKEIEKLKSKLPNYDLQNTTLTILQGFAYLKDANSDNQKSQLTVALNIKDKQLQALQAKLDSIAIKEKIGHQVFKELKTHYPNLESCILEKAVNHTDTVDQTIWIAMLKSNKSLHPEDQQKIEAWLKVRMNISKIKMHFE
ncbi:MAG: DUF389 domain-containing protein [Bacteroidia bacterium]|nr:DUF389 domain-containing protein [Bacteroidia bacterium]MBP7243975.1 DUF389 domain-containing protein [Bacteroidia bacterium]